MSQRIVPNPPSLYNEADDAYRGHMLEQYKHFVEMTMKYWSHIESANQFFLSLHTVILSGFTYLFTSRAILPTLVLAMLVLIACALALQWLMVLRSLQRLNQVRHGIIQEWEAYLAAQPYRVECYKLYSDKNRHSTKYFRIQKLYMLVPLLVFLAYLVLGVVIAMDVRLVSV
jgi:hypothetical protein